MEQTEPPANPPLLMPWQQNTKHFIPRVLAIGTTDFKFLHVHIDALPRPPFDIQFTDATAIRYQVALLVIGSLRSAREIAFSSSKLWLRGHFLLASVGFRMLTELDGQLHWAEQKVLTKLESGDTVVPFERIQKLLLGTNSSVPLMRGGIGPHPVVNVMDFVRAADHVRPGVMNDYEFLCDSAHPSYLMQSWMLFAGPDHDNWTNETFASQTTPMLDRVLRIAEGTIISMQAVAERIMSAVVPIISAEAKAGVH